MFSEQEYEHQSADKFFFYIFSKFVVLKTTRKKLLRMKAIQFLVITSFLWIACQDSSTTNRKIDNDTVSTDSVEIDSTNYFGYSKDVYVIDSNTIKQNQSLSHFLPDYGFSFLDIHQMVEASERYF